MTRGQDSLAIELDRPRAAAGTPVFQGERPQLLVMRPSEDELLEHARLLADIEAENKAQCVWRRFEAAVELR
jgi:DNA polymerase-3 subunit epsilon